MDFPTASEGLKRGSKNRSFNFRTEAFGDCYSLVISTWTCGNVCNAAGQNVRPTLCPACGGERRTVMLREVLPELAKLHKADIEIVSGEAANIMRKEGSMGAWLRRAKLAAAR